MVTYDLVATSKFKSKAVITSIENDSPNRFIENRSKRKEAEDRLNKIQEENKE